MRISQGMRGLAVAATMALPALAVADVPMFNMPDLYADADFSERAKLFHGQDVAMEGFMAPPLKVDARFFVLTDVPLAICPFCEDIAEWPEDIVVVYTKDILAVAPYDQRLQVTGTLELGAWTDPETGFVSKVRLVDSDFRRLPTPNAVKAWGIFRY